MNYRHFLNLNFHLNCWYNIKRYDTIAWEVSSSIETRRYGTESLAASLVGKLQLLMVIWFRALSDIRDVEIWDARPSSLYCIYTSTKWLLRPTASHKGSNDIWWFLYQGLIFRCATMPKKVKCQTKKEQTNLISNRKWKAFFHGHK